MDKIIRLGAKLAHALIDLLENELSENPKEKKDGKRKERRKLSSCDCDDNSSNS